MDQIEFGDFQKIKMKVGQIISAEKVENSDKLIKMQVNIGESKIQVVSSIADWYKPEELIGFKPIVIVNLKPAKFRGELSEGMLLTAEVETENKVVLLSPSKDINVGADIR
ncbi:MAG: methionine--tRNA ligase subunit beta [Candidatus Gracilibacteria bacterium]|jgi:methionine--tRNA ligase beta chain